VNLLVRAVRGVSALLSFVVDFLVSVTTVGVRADKKWRVVDLLGVDLCEATVYEVVWNGGWIGC